MLDGMDTTEYFSQPLTGALCRAKQILLGITTLLELIK